MSVATEGVEEMLFEGARETRFSSKVTQICAKINELLEQVQKDDVVEINLPDELVRWGVKERIHRRLVNSAEAFNPAWFVESNVICCVGNAQRRPDVGIWTTPPTGPQQLNPIVNQCPPPDAWIEVFFDQDPDRRNVFNRVNHCKRYWDFIEYIGIAVPGTTRRNPNPAQASTAVVLQNNRPNRPPYGIYWDVAGNPPVYFTYTWNNHLLLTCGWAIDFNIVLNAIP
ncbi:unnamed protein product [Rhizophagus irregularis]|nr:unnamed protein product [Rhizophagus irregularis]